MAINITFSISIPDDSAPEFFESEELLFTDLEKYLAAIEEEFAENVEFASPSSIENLRRHCPTTKDCL